MKKITYPIVTYQITQGAVLGIMAGTDYQVMERSKKAVIAAFEEYLKRDYKKNNNFQDFDISDFKFKVLGTFVRPTYQLTEGMYPASKQVRIEMPVIYGKLDKDVYQCYLPLLGSSFYYYDPEQMKVLAQHFIAARLSHYPPAKLYQLMGYGAPELSSVSLRVREEGGIGKTENYTFKPQYQTLERLAERLPRSKSLQKRINALPQTAWELEDKVDELTEKLINQSANVLLVGKRGTGKSAVLQQVIRKIASNTDRKKNTQTFWRMMPQRLTASSKYLGEWQEAAEELVDELQSVNGILWVANIVELLRSGGAPETGVAAYLLPFVQAGKLQLVGEVTPTELDSIRRILPGFAESFQLIHLSELSERKTFSILKKCANYANTSLKIKVQPEALALAYRLLKRYYPYESFPGKGIRFFGRALNDARIRKSDAVERADVVRLFTQQTGLPELFLRDEILLDKEKLSEWFEQRIMGQPAAIDKVSSIIQVFKAGINNPHKPIATLLFTGPTGVGKTATAKALADYFFGQSSGKNPLVRIDMSEYSSPSQLYRFIGFGNQAGVLTEAIRQRPFSVLLLDEVEKASPIIFDALLTVLDEGVMTDKFGRQTNFRNTIVIMTSNLGASNRKSISFKETTPTAAKYESAIHKFFRPEFVNRIDSIITFNSLQKSDIEKIALKELEDLREREGFVKQGIQLEFTDELVKHLAAVGFDEKYGARPLQRSVDRQVMLPLADWLLKNPQQNNIKLQVGLQADKVFITLIRGGIEAKDSL